MHPWERVSEIQPIKDPKKESIPLQIKLSMLKGDKAMAVHMHEAWQYCLKKRYLEELHSIFECIQQADMAMQPLEDQGA